MKCISASARWRRAFQTALSLSSVRSIFGSFGGGRKFFICCDAGKAVFFILDRSLCRAQGDVFTCRMVYPQWKCAAVKFSHIGTDLSGESPVTTHPPLCGTQITFIPIPLISSTIVTLVLKRHAAVPESRRLPTRFLWIFCDSLMTGPSRRARPRASLLPNETLEVAQPRRNDDAVLCSGASGTPDPICFPAVLCAACHPQPHQTAPQTNTQQLMRGYANTTLFSSSSFMHGEIMRLLSERAAPHRLIHSRAAALKSLVKQMKTSCSVAPLMGLRQLRNCKRSVQRREEFSIQSRYVTFASA